MVILNAREESETRTLLEIEVPAEEVERAFGAITRQYAKKAAIPGFRKGHAPEAVVSKRYAGEIREDVAIYTNYQPKNGVQVAMQVSRERDGRRISQFFYESCEVNPPLPGDYFTREALVQLFKETGAKKGK